MLLLSLCLINSKLRRNMSLLTSDKITEIFCLCDEFCIEYSHNLEEKDTLPANDGIKHRKRALRMSDSEIMTILMLYHFGCFKNFKYFYFFYVKEHLKKEFPNQLSYNRFVEIQCRVFAPMILFLNMFCAGKCTSITFVDSTKIKVRHNKRIYRYKIFVRE